LIITALQVELDAILALLEPYQTIHREGGRPSTYYRAKVDLYVDGGYSEVVVMMTGAMGNTAAGVQAGNAIREWHPRYVLMVGIAAGIGDDVGLGDVLVSTEVFNYEPAKLTAAGEKRRPTTGAVSHHLVGRAQSYHNADWREMIAVEPPESDTSRGGGPFPRVHFGPFASGEKVVADPQMVAKLLDMHSKLIAIEMESYGVAHAAACDETPPGFLAIRGVSDHANHHKDDRYHEYAAHAAAAFAIGFLRSGFPRHVGRERPRPAATLITVRHQSMDRIAALAVQDALPPDLVNHHIAEWTIDQSDLHDSGRLSDPREAGRRMVGLAQQVDALLAQHPEAIVAYYGIAHIPLIFLAGFILAHRRQFRFFDFNRGQSRWNQLQQGEGGAYPPLRVKGRPQRNRLQVGDVVVTVSISFPVTAVATAGVVRQPIASIHLSVDEPRIDLVQSEEQVREYGGVFRQVLDEIHKVLPNTTRVHVFYAGPPAVAFHFGQQISRTYHPHVVVYNYFRGDQPPYSWGIELDANPNDPGFLVTPGKGEEC
jgi:nucleoside phosphorylase